MSKCDSCNAEGNMPIIVTEDTQENRLETHFCSEKCLVEFFNNVISLG